MFAPTLAACPGHVPHPAAWGSAAEGSRRAEEGEGELRSRRCGCGKATPGLLPGKEQLWVWTGRAGRWGSAVTAAQGGTAPPSAHTALRFRPPRDQGWTHGVQRGGDRLGARREPHWPPGSSTRRAGRCRLTCVFRAIGRVKTHRMQTAAAPGDCGPKHPTGRLHSRRIKSRRTGTWRRAGF